MPKGIKGSARTYNCKHCGTESKWGPSKRNIYCSVKCQMDDKKEQILELWLRGEYTNKHGKFPGVAVEHVLECQNHKCAICGIINWNNKPIVLQQDHIDGNPNNLWPDNLQMLCPNCHSQTETWGTKSRGPKVEKKRDYRNEYRRRHYKLAKDSA